MQLREVLSSYAGWGCCSWGYEKKVGYKGTDQIAPVANKVVPVV